MDKGSIQKFAVGARVELIEAVKLRAYWYGVTAEGCGELDTTAVNGKPLTPAERDQRAALVREVERNGYPQVMEEAAYTWFNRFIALRFLEVNGYLPSRVRVFSDPEGRSRPEILTTALEVELPGLDREYIEGCIRENRTEELYRYLLLCQCNALHDALPVMFERVENWTELLLPDHLLKEGGVLARLVSDIPEEDWTDQVQILGWLYQYYNTEVKAETFALLKKNVKITRERIPSATQLFTPDWIVRYMVENSLGRLWLEGHPGGELRAGWRYYLDEAEQEPEVAAQLEALRKNYAKMSPQDIKVIDPCCGSGHILVYAFDVFIEIYKSQGIRERDAAAMILENNLYGLDIDPRAAQLAWFAVMMKARQYDRQIFQKPAKPQVYSPKGYPEGEEFGSLLTVENLEPEPETVSMYEDDNYNRWRFRRVLAGRYDVVVTNPPYMGRRNTNSSICEFLDANYQSGKMDLFSAFIIKNIKQTKQGGFIGFMTPFVWLYLSSYTQLRNYILRTTSICQYMQPAETTFKEAAVNICSFVLRKYKLNYRGSYVWLDDKKNINRQNKLLQELAQKNLSNYMYFTIQNTFEKYPDSRIIFWGSNELQTVFQYGKELGEICQPRQGMATTNNDLFLRLWFETEFKNIGFEFENEDEAEKSKLKWFPYNKGGGFRKWFGNNEYIVNYEKKGLTICNYIDNTPGARVGSNGRIINRPFFFKKSITWSDICGSSFAARSCKKGFIFDVKGSSAFVPDELYEYILALFNSKMSVMLLNVLNPTVTTQVGDLKKLPYICSNDNVPKIKLIVSEAIKLSKNDWDSFETSWDFRRHPLI